MDALRHLTRLNDISPRQARLVNLRNPHTGEIIDQALVLYFAKPASETGEDSIEIQCHGAPTVISTLLELLAKIPGLRLAEPGEFTRRAFLNGKLDLTAVEGLADLVAAETESQRQLAINQLTGKTAAQYHQWAESLAQALAFSEALIDFADEEIPQSTVERITNIIEKTKAEIAKQLNDDHRGEILRSGIQLAIVGDANVGKSSLLNYLSKRDAAIVSPIAGTTRDAIEVSMDIGGFRVILVDTAGIRATDDPVEQMGIERSFNRAKNSQLLLHMIDAQSVIQNAELKIPNYGPMQLVIINKIDLCSEVEKNFIRDKLSQIGGIAISLKESENLENLWQRLESIVRENLGYAPSEPPLITRQRHRKIVEQVAETLNRIEPSMPREIIAEELRYGVKLLGRITGKIAVDDLLDIIFSEFCLGK